MRVLYELKCNAIGKKKRLCTRHCDVFYTIFLHNFIYRLLFIYLIDIRVHNRHRQAHIPIRIYIKSLIENRWQPIKKKYLFLSTPFFVVTFRFYCGFFRFFLLLTGFKYCRKHFYAYEYESCNIDVYYLVLALVQLDPVVSIFHNHYSKNGITVSPLALHPFLQPFVKGRPPSIVYSYQSYGL